LIRRGFGFAETMRVGARIWRATPST